MEENFTNGSYLLILKETISSNFQLIPLECGELYFGYQGHAGQKQLTVTHSETISVDS